MIITHYCSAFVDDRETPGNRVPKAIVYQSHLPVQNLGSSVERRLATSGLIKDSSR